MLAYSKGYYYMVEEDYSIMTPIIGYNIETPYYALITSGRQYIFRGYAWDGPTCYFKLKRLIRPSCLHDVHCQMMREGQIPHSLYKLVNQFFYEQCLISGISVLQAKAIKLAVDMYRPCNPKKGVVHPTYYVK